MIGGELYVPKLPSIRVTDLAEAMLPGCEVENVGIRPGEKLHEVMVPRDDARTTVEFDRYYVIEPAFQFWDRDAFSADRTGDGRPVAEEFEYDSGTNEQRLSPEQLREHLQFGL
jgi:UDP-N-acetylglucosamine 4,6-dehydratase